MLKKLLLTGLTTLQLSALQSQENTKTTKTALTDTLKTETVIPKRSGVKAMRGVDASVKVGDFGSINTLRDNGDAERTFANGYKIIDNADVQGTATRNRNNENATTINAVVQAGNFQNNNYGANTGVDKYVLGDITHTTTKIIAPDSLHPVGGTQTTTYIIGRIPSSYGDNTLSTLASQTSYTTNALESTALGATAPYGVNNASVSQSWTQGEKTETIGGGIQKLDNGTIGGMMQYTYQNKNHTLNFPLFTDRSGVYQQIIFTPTYVQTKDAINSTTKRLIGVNLQTTTLNDDKNQQQIINGSRGIGSAWSKAWKNNEGTYTYKISAAGDVGNRGQQLQGAIQRPLTQNIILTLGAQIHNGSRTSTDIKVGGYIGALYAGVTK